MIRNATLEDAFELAEIYNYYILNSTITFEETRIDAEEMKSRMESIIEEFPWLVYESNGQIIGYAYASKWKGRCAYKHSVESTVYLKNGEEAKGVGTLLYTELIKRLSKIQIHAIIGGIALPNKASISLHKKLGFQQVAHFKEVGYKFEKWIDVTYWELLINNHK
ncbi:arsinothricin resistance N-acetyltransferase ArsN1 family B [Aquimarina agarilytica]|uniref:arsinothricin resistance N-acetyltransferase ArsN1 family B n=1 Tax=Aquimarina agarilytica TaxID=1087449 RepID=UPI000288976F|nr:arsinothricin resistance N-acetyltransferase ArsN1 family B [Aquimarina agarilytica]